MRDTVLETVLVFFNQALYSPRLLDTKSLIDFLLATMRIITLREEDLVRKKRILRFRKLVEEGMLIRQLRTLAQQRLEQSEQLLAAAARIYDFQHRSFIRLILDALETPSSVFSQAFLHDIIGALIHTTTEM